MQSTRITGQSATPYHPTNGSNGSHSTDASAVLDGLSPPADREVALDPALEPTSGTPETRKATIPFFDGVRRFIGLAPDASSEEPDTAGPATGIHAITKKTNQWFDREVGVLERDARTYASEWAGKGLPRHDVARATPLEVEQVLAGRCVEVFRQWVERVRVKMSDAIASEADLIGTQLEELRNTTAQLERLDSDISTVDARVKELRAEAKADALRIEVDPFVSSKTFFWSFAIALTLVEFFANFPVFRLLLPLNAALAKAADVAGQDVNLDGWLSGFAVQLKEMSLHAEALVVALVAVLVLVLFGKTLGSSARALFALRSDEQPLAAVAIGSFRRQHGAALAGCVLGLAAVLFFLFQSRATIASVAQSRVAADSVELDRLERESQHPGSPTELAVITTRLVEQQRTLETHREDRAYATMVQNNNVPLFFLNIGLVFAAALLGYLTYHRVVNGHKGENPVIAQLRANREALQSHALAAVQEGRGAESRARAGIGRAEHLMTASPLAEWKAKVDRLTGVIPLFRAENARLRGIDPASILAFGNPPPLSLPTVEAERGFPEPASFARLKEEFEVCRKNLGTVTPRIPINPSDPVTA